jgi:hypothetical protein
MATDHIRYDLLAQEALRGVVRTVLTDAAKNGLPGEHHFFITFDTHAEGVQLSNRMRAQYPEDMTIVLQHQFWDLNVGPERFEVGLSFGGTAEKLGIPFAAVVGFSDPSVPFRLQFQTITEAEAATPETEASLSEGSEATSRPTAPSMTVVPGPGPAVVADGDKAEKSDKPEKSGGGEVVRLDRFRKK